MVFSHHFFPVIFPGLQFCVRPGRASRFECAATAMVVVSVPPQGFACDPLWGMKAFGYWGCSCTACTACRTACTACCTACTACRTASAPRGKYQFFWNPKYFLPKYVGICFFPKTKAVMFLIAEAATCHAVPRGARGAARGAHAVHEHPQGGIQCNTW